MLKRTWTRSSLGAFHTKGHGYCFALTTPFGVLIKAHLTSALVTLDTSLDGRNVVKDHAKLATNIWSVYCSRRLSYTMLLIYLFLESGVLSKQIDLFRFLSRTERASENNQVKQRRAWLLLGQVTAERSCPCKRPACPAIGGGSEVTFKPLVPRLSVREGFLALTSPAVKSGLASWTDEETGEDTTSFLEGIQIAAGCV
ncbi:hypothetical protein J6590_085222 [Homalodisca vitripennis]|nr:hypothetical protein J6590_085222 [Homalodisca vitripennis]